VLLLPDFKFAVQSVHLTRPGYLVLEAKRTFMECAILLFPANPLPGHPGFPDLNITALVMMVSNRCQNESALIRNDVIIKILA